MLTKVKPFLLLLQSSAEQRIVALHVKVCVVLFCGPKSFRPSCKLKKSSHGILAGNGKKTQHNTKHKQGPFPLVAFYFIRQRVLLQRTRFLQGLLGKICSTELTQCSDKGPYVMFRTLQRTFGFMTNVQRNCHSSLHHGKFSNCQLHFDYIFYIR